MPGGKCLSSEFISFQQEAHTLFSFIQLFFFQHLEIESRALLSRYSTTELYPWPSSCFCISLYCYLWTRAKKMFRGRKSLIYIWPANLFQVRLTKHFSFWDICWNQVNFRKVFYALFCFNLIPCGLNLFAVLSAFYTYLGISPNQQAVLHRNVKHTSWLR